MNHLTNLYKHKCEQLQEQINNIKKMLSEAAVPTPTQPQTYTKTNNQMSNDSFVNSVPTNNISLKKTPGDIPTPTTEEEEFEDYVRWVERMLKQWEKENPYPVWEDNMTQAEFEALIQMWLNALWQYQIEIEHEYKWRIRDGFGNPRPFPRPDQTPPPIEPNETSPKPPIVLPYPAILTPWLQHDNGPQRGYWDDDWVQGREWA
jgi:hypothetical protein